MKDKHRIRQRHKWKITGMSIAIVVISVLVSGFILMWMMQHTSPTRTTQIIEGIKPWMLIWRLLLYTAIIIGWPLIVKVIAGYMKLDDIQYALLIDARQKMVLWILIFELIFAQNVLWQFIGIFT